MRPAISFHSKNVSELTSEGFGTAWQQEPQENITGLQGVGSNSCYFHFVVNRHPQLSYKPQILSVQNNKGQGKFYFGGLTSKNTSPGMVSTWACGSEI